MEQTIHGTDEQFEAYAMGRLSDSEQEMLEEHLLVCAPCRRALDQNLVFISGMREAARDAAFAPAPQRDWLAWIRPVFAPRFALAGGLAALIAGIGLYFTSLDRVHYTPVAALQLAAIRGETPTVEPVRELDLTLNSFPASGGPFKVEIVDAAGGHVWSGATTSPAITVHEKFRPGIYFVRLYTGDGELLHEYGFRVEAEK